MNPTRKKQAQEEKQDKAQQDRINALNLEPALPGAMFRKPLQKPQKKKKAKKEKKAQNEKKAKSETTISDEDIKEGSGDAAEEGEKEKAKETEKEGTEREILE